MKMPVQHRLYELAYWDAWWEDWFDRFHRASFFGFILLILTGFPYILVYEFRRRRKKL